MGDRKSRRKRSGSSDNWQTTYGDMVTLLLTFFVLLFSFSTINEAKWKELVFAFTGSTAGGKIIPTNGNGNEDFTPPPLPTPTPKTTPSETPIESKSPTPTQTPKPTPTVRFPDNIDEIYNGIIGFVKDFELETKVEVNKTDFEIIIRFTDNVMFESGKADLKPEFHGVLSAFANILDRFEEEIEMIRIEGHTDNRPINTWQFPSNWELSTARAVTVLRYLIEEKGFSPIKISAVGYGEYHPVDTNETAEGRARNRRVDFVITRSADITITPED